MVIYVFRAGRNTDPRIPGGLLLGKVGYAFLGFLLSPGFHRIPELEALLFSSFLSFLLPPSLCLSPIQNAAHVFSGSNRFTLDPREQKQRKSFSPRAKPETEMEGDPS